MVGPGIQPETHASEVRCSATDLSKAIYTVHLDQTTTHTQLNKLFIFYHHNNKIFFVLISDYMHVSLLTTDEWIKGLLQLQSIAKLQ